MSYEFQRRCNYFAYCIHFELPYEHLLIIKRTDVAIEMLNEKIQQLETLFAELLAEGADSVLLRKVWKEIQTLRQQLQQLTNSESKNE